MQGAAPRSGQTALLIQARDEQIESSPADVVLERLGEKLNMSWLCALSAQRANTILGCGKQSVTSRNRGEIVPVYSALMRLHLDLCIPLWSPQQEGDMQLLEWGQKTATKTIRGNGASPLEDRLRKLDLFSLEKRKLQADFITAFQY